MNNRNSFTYTSFGRAFSLFLVSRFFILVLLEKRISDIPVYKHYADLILDGYTPYVDFSVEYPPLALICIIIPALLAQYIGNYALCFRLEMFLFDLSLFLLLSHVCRHLLRCREEETKGVLSLYVVLTALCYHILYDRFDLVIAFLFLVILFFVATKRFLGGYVLIFVGLFVKFVPLLVLPIALMCELRAQRSWKALCRNVLIAGAGAAALVMTAVAVFGPAVQRCISYHSHRGIHIESLYSSLVLLTTFFGKSATVNHEYGAYHITSSFTPILTIVSPFLLAGVSLVTYMIIWRGVKAFQSYETERLNSFITLSFLSILGAFFITSRVFSPQFLLWVFPLVSLVTPRMRNMRTFIILWAAIVLFTTTLFPFDYSALVQLFTRAKLLLLLRNSLVLIAFGQIVWRLFRVHGDGNTSIDQN